VNVLELTRLGAHHVRNAVAEEIYLRTGRDFTVPISIYGEVVERCNYKCRYCEYWRRPHYRDEMPIEDWKKALLDLKDFIGHYHIEFAGGEPYIKKGFVELLTFCGEQGLKWGVTTNGGAFGNQKVVDWTVAAKPFNINISIDSNDARVHDYER
jgi:MoaA/NifB/PqqE/SkfB family radical SAM enzyme